jgi:hypothetical protein
MKCIYCENDAKYADRQDGHCPKCRKKFAFEPQKGAKLTDGAFKAAIDRVSSRGTVKWTKDHLYYEIGRRLSKRWTTSITLFVLGAVAALGAFAWGGALVATVLLWIFAFGNMPVQWTRFAPHEFEALWGQWIAVHGVPPSLIVRKELPAARAPRALPSDIEAYSFDRAVITDRPETVDLLIANNFHFENNCAVLCIDSYPPQVFDTVRTMLKKNPKLVVYALHDATLEGCLLAHRLAKSPAWFHGSARVIDVGLSPRHAGHFKGSLQLQKDGFKPSPLLSDADNKWLSRYTLELSVIPPEQLIKRTFSAMTIDSKEALPASSSTTTTDDGFVIYYIHSGTLSTDARTSDGGGDSFG